jgi:hypothetical protein
MGRKVFGDILRNDNLSDFQKVQLSPLPEVRSLYFRTYFACQGLSISLRAISAANLRRAPREDQTCRTKAQCARIEFPMPALCVQLAHEEAEFREQLDKNNCRPRARF